MNALLLQKIEELTLYVIELEKKVDKEKGFKCDQIREWTVFNYKLPDDMSKGMIKITDVYGKLIEIFTINGKQGQKVWDTRHIEPGIYFYTIKVAGLSKSGKIIINK
jgi:hypothetical protein